MAEYYKYRDMEALAVNSDDPWDEDVLLAFVEGNMVELPKLIVVMAALGEREYIREAARHSVEMLGRISSGETLKTQDLYLLDWLQGKLSEVWEGKSPDEAFAWKIPGKSGRKKRLASVLADFSIYHDVLEEKERYPKQSLEEIFAIVGKRRNVSSSTVKTAYQECKKIDAARRNHHWDKH